MGYPGQEIPMFTGKYGNMSDQKPVRNLITIIPEAELK